MLAEEFNGVLSLETPTKRSLSNEDTSQECHAFYLQAKECLENFLECNDVDMIFQVRDEFREFCAKAMRAFDAMGPPQILGTSRDEPLERLQASGADLERTIVECQRRIHVCCEYHELRSTIFVAVERELEDMQDLLFQITEQRLSPNSRAKPHIGKAYTALKDKIAPLKASIQFIPLRVECYKCSAQSFFPASVAYLASECNKLTSRVHSFTQEFNKIDEMLKPEWWDPVLETTMTCARSRASRSNSGGVNSSIPVLNLRLKGQRKSVPPKFVSKLPKPTEVKSRPVSMDRVPPYGHYRSSSQWSTGSTLSQDSLPSPAEPVESPKLEARMNKLFDQAPLILPPTEPNMNMSRPMSRLVKPTPIDLSKIRHHTVTNKENEEFSTMPMMARRGIPPLSTIKESPNNLSSMIPTFSGSPTVRKHHRISHLHQTSLR